MEKYLTEHEHETLRRVSQGVHSGAEKIRPCLLMAKREIISNYASIDGAQVIQEYAETESGKETNNRPRLQEANEFCKINYCILIVAKLERLSRDIEHILILQKQLGDRFKSCDLPSYDSLILSIFAGLAQREREIFSIRTRQALKAKKAQGARRFKKVVAPLYSRAKNSVHLEPNMYL